MTEINIIIPAVTAFLAAALTLMTGFGLGTILTPVFLLFYDVKIAILIVAVVHLLNNLLKFSLFSRHINHNRGIYWCFLTRTDEFGHSKGLIGHISDIPWFKRGIRSWRKGETSKEN